MGIEIRDQYVALVEQYVKPRAPFEAVLPLPTASLIAILATPPNGMATT
jgi:hypothetical protein